MKAAGQLKIGEKGIIQQFTDELLAGKFLEMGWRPGVELSLLRVAPFGGPMYVRVGRNRFALRRQEAMSVLLG